MRLLRALCAIVFASVVLPLPGAAQRPDETPAPNQAVPPPKISALHYYGYEGALDEAIQLSNPAPGPVALDANWFLVDEANHRLSFPAAILEPGGRMWVTRDRAAFARQFGFTPTLAYDQMSGASLSLPNDGGSVRLIHATSAITTPSAQSVIDTANSGATRWDAGSKTPWRASMERVDAGAPNLPSNWQTAVLPASPAVDASGIPITGTPRGRNTAALTPSLPSDNSIVINEIAWSGTPSSPTREWVELLNTLATTVSLSGWKLTISGTSLFTVTLGGEIAAGGTFLIQRYADTFGPGTAADLTASGLQLRDDGAVLSLLSFAPGSVVTGEQTVVDTVVYGNGLSQPGWTGLAVQPYTVTYTIPAEGQLLMRRLDPSTGLAATDTDMARDWLNDRTDLAHGRRPIYPGWDYERFARPVTATGTLTLAITPDGGFEVLSPTLASAQHSLDVEAYTFDQPALAGLLRARASQGVRVRVLLDGAPAGGLTDQDRWVCQQISTSGNPDSGCWYMRADVARNIHTRYPNLHAKFAIVDDRLLVIGSENFGVNSFPDDDKTDGTVGHRGVVAVVDAPAVVARAREIFDADIDARHADLVRWCEACAPYGPPAPGFTPVFTTGGISYTVRFAAPMRVETPVPMALATSPESDLDASGLLGILSQAGPGDEILAQQLDEPVHWGGATGTLERDPNLRLQALLDAAKRGASVRLSLDRYYDDAYDPRSNRATADYLASLARANGWDIRAAVGNPTFHGIHNKLFLARIGGRKFAQIGSWNGSEISAKRNREMTLLIESAAVYDALRTVFFHDFWMSQPVFVPLAMRDYAPPQPITHPLVSEVLFNPGGADEAGREWIEVYNPTDKPMALDGYKIGDAEAPGRNYNESMYRFPAAATLAARGALVVAGRADLFWQDWGRQPDYELADYDPAVPELLQYTAWSTGTLSLGNAGDQVVLLGPNDEAADVLVWGVAAFTGTLPFTQTLAPDHTLQRWPPDRDTGDCAVDFRDQAIPSPGAVP